MTSRSMAACYIALLLAHLGLIWILPYFPTQDGAAHIYNLVILGDLINGGREWGAYYDYRLRAVPNLGFILITYPLLKVVPALVTEKIFLSLFVILMGVSVPFFLSAFDKKPLPVSFFMFPLLLAYPVLMGFYSFIISVPLFLIAFSLAWKLRSASFARRFVLYNLLGVLLFFCHLIPFVIFLMSVSAITLASPEIRRNIMRKMFGIVLMLVPSVALLFYYFSENSKQSFRAFSYLPNMQHYIDLFVDLLFFSSGSLTPLQYLPASFFAFLTLLCINQYLKNLATKESGCTHISWQEKTLMLVILFLVPIYFLAPWRLGEGSYFNERLPWIILLVSLPLFRMPASWPFYKFGERVIVLTVSVFFAVSASAMWKESKRTEQFLGGIESIPKKSYIMSFKQDRPKWPRADTLLHASSYYGIINGCVDAGNYQASRAYFFLVRFRKDIPQLPPADQIDYEPAAIDLAKYPSLTYILSWDLAEKGRNSLSSYYSVLRNKERLTLWKRK